MENTTEHQYPKANTSSMAKTILVIGGAGYIGSHICKLLVKNGYAPVVIDHNLESKPWANSFGPAFNLNLPIELSELEAIIKRFEIDTVIHLAAYTAVGESVSNPSKYYKNNLVMTLQLLDKLIKLDVKKFIFSSSAAVYGIPNDPNGICRIEDHVKPINPYGQSKFMVENILQDYYKAHGLMSISLRYFNASGADPEAEIGELRDRETHIIPLAINASLQNKEFFMFGDDYNTPDGSCVRDYVHVMDLAQAHINAVQHIGKDKIECDRFNLGSGVPTSNKQLLESVAKHVGKFTITTKPRRLGDPDSLVADISKTTEKLFWKPEMSSIDKIVSSAVNWHSKQKGIKH